MLSVCVCVCVCVFVCVCVNIFGCCVLCCPCVHVCLCVCVDNAERMGHDVGGLSQTLSVYNIGPVGQNIMHCLSLTKIIISIFLISLSVSFNLFQYQ